MRPMRPAGRTTSPASWPTSSRWAPRKQADPDTLRASVSIRRVDPLLGTCSLPELRQRKSFKWRTYPPDVLPAFVAEMDFAIAEPIIRAVTAALARGDTGY